MDTLPSPTETPASQVCAYYGQLIGCEIAQVENNKLYDIFEEWQGTPYRYAGKTKEGIDCSDFSAVLYREAYGIQLQGSASDIYKTTVPVERQALKEGDLVFFKINRGRISHVGVYLAHDKFVHATTKAGVIVSDLDEPYYKKYFFKGGRLKNPTCKF